MLGYTSAIALRTGGTEVVLARGAAENTTVFGGGVESVLGGGLAFETVVGNGGHVVVSDTAETDSAMILSGGLLNVASGAIAIDTRLIGGTEALATGSLSSGTTTFAANATDSTLSIAAGLMFNVSGFAATDRMDFTDLKFGVYFKESFAGGLLTVHEGGLADRITLFGQYVAAGFHFAADGAGGTLVTYTQPTPAHTELAPSHT